MLLATIFLTALADAVSILRILPADAAAEDMSRPSRSLEEFSGVSQKQATAHWSRTYGMKSEHFTLQTSPLEPFLRFVRTTSSSDGEEEENLSYEERMEQERRLDLLCATVIEALRYVLMHSATGHGVIAKT